jgi:serine phosphatase RsbU (regulator of sigma subunit)
LQRGDLVCIVSDGITEAQNDRNALYGTARIENALSGRTSAAEVLKAIRGDVRKFVGDSAQSDDMTVFAVRWLGS